MIELLIEPAKTFVSGGIEAFRKSKEHQNLIVAVQDRIRREIRFNLAIFDEISEPEKHAEDLKLGLLRSVIISGFDDIDAGLLPLNLFFEEEIQPEIWPRSGFTGQEYLRFRGWLKGVRSQYDLLERVYHRMRIIRTFAECGKVYGSPVYIRFMLIAFEKSIAGSCIK